MMAGLRGFVLAFCVTLCLSEKIRYDGYQVLRMTPANDWQVEFLRHIESSVFGEQLSFWKGPSYKGNAVDIMVPPTLQQDFRQQLINQGIQANIMVENLQDNIDEEEANLTPYAFDYNNYNTIDTIYQWVADFAAGSDLVTEGDLGNSYEGRPLKYVKISSGGAGKKAIVFHGGIHAREWVTPATVIYMAKYLSEGSDDATRLLSYFDFYIIPVMNPDGYAYTWTNDRMWRKTRKPNSGSFCTGTDPNRNFATGWGGGGSSGSPCSDTYRGSSAFSEVETQAIRDFIIQLGSGNGVAMYTDYHAYSQYWMTPYGYQSTKPDNYETQNAGAAAAVTALRAVNGIRYQYGTIIDVIYQASGGSSDYMYADQEVGYSYATEGRDTGRYGFQLPANQIQPSAEENWAALVAVCDYIYANPQ